MWQAFLLWNTQLVNKNASTKNQCIPKTFTTTPKSTSASKDWWDIDNSTIWQRISSECKNSPVNIHVIKDDGAQHMCALPVTCANRHGTHQYKHGWNTQKKKIGGRLCSSSSCSSIWNSEFTTNRFLYKRELGTHLIRRRGSFFRLLFGSISSSFLTTNTRDIRDSRTAAATTKLLTELFSFPAAPASAPASAPAPCVSSAA